MGQENIYETPTSEILADNENTKAGWFLITSVVVLTLLNFGLSFILALFESNNIAYSIGSGFGALIVASIVVALFQIGKGFRNSKSRYTIFSIVLVITLISGSLQFITMLATRGNV